MSDLTQDARLHLERDASLTRTRCPVLTALLPAGGHQGSQGFTRGRQGSQGFTRVHQGSPRVTRGHQGSPETVNLSLGDNDATRLDLQVSDCPGTAETRTFLLLDRWEVQVGTALVGPLSKAWKASGLVF